MTYLLVFVHPGRGNPKAHVSWLISLHLRQNMNSKITVYRFLLLIVKIKLKSYILKKRILVSGYTDEKIEEYIKLLG